MAVHDEIIVVAGPPAAGKTSAARLLAARFEPLGCVIESDFWWTTIVNGYSNAFYFVSGTIVNGSDASAFVFLPTSSTVTLKT